jgi:hypothetical protein
MAKRGKSPDEIERALQLEAVPEPAAPKAGPGRGHVKEKPEEKTRGTECPMFSPRHEKQLRAITRAPDAVKDAYREGRVSQVTAAKLGPKNPTPELAAKVAEAAQEVRKSTTRKEADAAVRRVLGVKAPTLVEQTLRLVERMTESERLEFERQVQPLLEQARGA